MSFTVYMKTGAEVVNPIYFKRLTARQPGTSHVMLGRAKPVMSAGYSLMLVRRGWRTERVTQHIGGRYHRPQTSIYYRITSHDYVVATINWDSGQVIELSAHPTKNEATARMRQLHSQALGCQ